jgi:hypothetical protein
MIVSHLIENKQFTFTRQILRRLTGSCDSILQRDGYGFACIFADDFAQVGLRRSLFSVFRFRRYENIAPPDLPNSLI